MTGWQIVVFIAIFLFVDSIVVGTIIAMGRMASRELERDYPPAPPQPDAVSRRRQSLSIDMLNFGFCYTFIADGRCLHLRPNWFARIFGMRSISIPWSAIRVTKIGRFSGRAEVGKKTLSFNAWAMRLAKQINDAAAGAASPQPHTQRVS